MSELKDFLKRVEQNIHGKKSISVDLPTAKMIMAIKNKYEAIYPLFINEIESSDIPERKGVYEELKKNMKRVAELSDVLVGKKGCEATDAEVKEYVDLTKLIDDGITAISANIRGSRDLNKKVSDIEERSNISLDTIKNVSKVFSTNIKKKQSSVGGLKRGIGDIGHSLGGIFEGEQTMGGKMAPVDLALALTLGPLAPIAGYGMSAGKKIFDKFNQRRKARQMIGGEIGLISRELGLSSKDIEGFRGEQSVGKPMFNWSNPRGGSVPDLFKQFSGGQGSDVGSRGFGSSGGGFGMGLGLNKKDRIPGQFSSSDSMNTAVASGLNMFFSGAAFRALYTRRLLEAVEKGAKVRGMNPLSGGLGSILDIGKKIGAVLLKGTLIGIAGLIGWGVGTIIRKIFPQIDTFLTGVFADMIGEWRRLKENVGKKGLWGGIGKTINQNLVSPFDPTMESNPTFLQGQSSILSGLIAVNPLAAMMGYDDKKGARAIHSGFMSIGNAIGKTQMHPYIGNIGQLTPPEIKLSDKSKFFGHDMKDAYGNPMGSVPMSNTIQGREKLSEIQFKIQNLKSSNSRELAELNAIVKQLVESNKKQSGTSATIVAPSSMDNDPFMDAFNRGQFGEEF